MDDLHLTGFAGVSSRDVTSQTKLNGNTFNPASEIDPTNAYSKEVFAKSVVKANAAKIDFPGFYPLLERVQKAIRRHAA